MTDYEIKLQSILDYYGSDSTIWNKIQFGTASADDISMALSRIPERELIIDKSISGLTMGYSYADPVYLETYRDPILDNINSNYSGGQYSNAINPHFNGNFGYDSETGQYFVETGAKNGLGQALSTIADRACLAVTGVNIGCKLGKLIDETLYNIDPEWWDNHYPTINPQTWTTIAGQDETGKQFIRTLFNIDDNGMTAYVDADVMAQTYMMLRDTGMLNSSASLQPEEITTGQNVELSFITGTLQELGMQYFGAPLPENMVSTWGNTDAILCLTDYGTTVFIATPSEPNGTITLLDNYTVTNSPYGDANVYKVNHEFSNVSIRGWNRGSDGYLSNYLTSSTHIEYVSNGANGTESIVAYVGDLILPVMPDIPDSTQYPPTNITGTDLPTVKQQLRDNYPDLFQDSIFETTLQPDGTLTTKEYVPVPWTEGNTQNTDQPKTGDTTQTDLDIDPTTGDKIITTSPMLPPADEYPTSGTGESPVSPMPIGKSSSLWSVYNPTQTEVDNFGSWLWTSDLVEQIKKMFNDPMQAIIGIHKVFATPHTNGRGNIKCGYIDSNVSAALVDEQYTEINCGTISLYEYFGNVFDYNPYTSVRVYLPFIGIVPLNVADIMRSKISIKYKVDVITGACIAEISVKRDGYNNVIYTYTGSAIVSYPLSSGSYAGVVTAALSFAASVARGSVLGAVGSVASAHADTEVHGNFSGSAGAMGGKKPYLIISRPQTKLTKDESSFDGFPSGSSVLIGNCIGYIKCQAVHLKVETATDSELNEIERFLLNGVRLTSSNDNGTPLDPEYNTIEPIWINANGVYTPSGDVIGFSPVHVNVTPQFTPADEGKVVDNGQLVSQTNMAITDNGVYDTTTVRNVSVNVQSGSVDLSPTQSAIAIIVNGDTTAQAIDADSYVYIKNHSTYTEGLYKTVNALSAGDSVTGNVTAVSDGGLNAIQRSMPLLEVKMVTISSGTAASDRKVGTINANDSKFISWLFASSSGFLANMYIETANAQNTNVWCTYNRYNSTTLSSSVYVKCYYLAYK